MNVVIKKILQIIKKAGFEAYIVGGYPRDYYLGRKTTDYDITTSATPEELKSLFSHVHDEEAKYGRVTVEVDDCTFEITTYRKDGFYNDHRKPEEVIYVKELSEDLLRRDFIMNTLCMDEIGSFVDLLGAREDIDQKLIRTVGDANQKIEEDSLRILRAIRFAACLNFQLDVDLKEAIKQYKENLKGLSYFRKKDELNHIFTSDYVMYGISLLKELELEEELEIFGIDHLNTNTSLLGIWAQLDFSSKYEFSRSETKEIETIRALLHENILDPKVIYQYGHYYCMIVAEIKGEAKNKILDIYQHLPIHHRNEIAISPKELEQLVSKDMIGIVYEDIEGKILDGELENLKVFLKKYIIENYDGRK